MQFAQSFIPSEETISKISLYLFKNGDPTGIIVSIRDDLNNDDLTSGYLAGSDIKEEKKAGWYEFNFPEIEVTPGNTYYIVMTSDDNAAANAIYWLFGENNPYPNGLPWKQIGYIWEEFVELDNGDFCFKTFYAKSKIKSINVNLLKEKIMDWIFERYPLLELLLQKKSPQPKGFSLNPLPSFVHNPGKLFN